MIEVGKSLPVYQEFAGPDPSSHTRLFLGHGNTKGARVCDICVCVCACTMGEEDHFTMETLVYLALSDPEYSDLPKRGNGEQLFTCYTKLTICSTKGFPVGGGWPEVFLGPSSELKT